MTLALLVMWAGALTVRYVVDPTAVGDAMPWPVQLGLNGVTLGALIAFFVWQNKQITNGKWYPGPIVDKMLGEKDVTIAGHALLTQEQSRTIKANEATMEAQAKALVQATSNQSWIDTLVKRSLGVGELALGGGTIAPKSGDTPSPKEVS